MTAQPRQRHHHAAVFTRMLRSAVPTSTLRQTLSIAAGFYAKQLCSEVFVAGRNAQDVIRDDLRQVRPRALMRLMKWEVDQPARTARAHIFGLASRVARYHPLTGGSLSYGPPPRHDTDHHRRDQRLVAQAVQPEISKASTSDWLVRMSDRLTSVVDHAFAHDMSGPQGTRAVVIVHDGAIVAERYAPGFSVDSRLPGWSIAKSVVHALSGILLGNGRLRVEDRFPVAGWLRDDRRRIVWEDMLRMRSGLDFSENYRNPLSDVNTMLFGNRSAAAVAAASKLAARPGTAWKYSSGTTNLITHAWRTVIPREAYVDFPRRSLFDRIGMTSALMETDEEGDFVGSSFIYATARDFARFGWLYAMDGMWGGDRILPAGWVAHGLRPTAQSNDGLYGAHFWVSVPPDQRHHFEQRMPEMLHATGFGGQRITIVPSRRLVIVRLGLATGKDSWGPWPFIGRVLSAVS